MNKSEKLLAARKRLKEFQMSKKGNIINDDVNKYGNENEDKQYRQMIGVDGKEESELLKSRELSPVRKIGETVIQEQFETLELITNRENGSNDETKIEDFPNPSKYFQDSVDRINDVSQVPDLAKEMNNSVDLKSDVFDTNVNIDAEIGSQDEIDVLKKNLTDKEDLKTDIIHSVNDYGSLAGSQTLQKEYLLQMSSALANVLTNDKETGVIEELNSDLEERNQFLASCLEDQKDIVNRLNIEVGQYKTRIGELEAALATKDVEFEGKLHRELNPLKEQLNLHAQTTGILVGEKAELTAALLQSQTTAKQKVAEVEELNGKLKSMQIQLSEMERELNSLKNSTEDFGKANHKLQASYDTLENKYSQIKLERDDLELETAELRQKLNVKNTEITNIEQELKEKTALLSLNELRMQQMTSSPQGNQGIGEQHHVVAALEQQLSQLMETLKSVSSERDEASSHYQNYVHQLNAQVTGLALKLEETTKENAELNSRENSLIKRLSELEKQIQSKKEIPEPQPIASVFNDTNKERIEELEKSMDQLIIERDSLRDSLNEKEMIIESIKRETEELQEIRSSNAEASRLASALEGERLAAARAVSQNQQLKQQLSEMQDAFVQLSNAKLDLTEQLQGERAIGRKLNARLNDTENDVDKLKEDILRKDLLIAEFEKEKLHAAQIADQMQHYQAQSHYAGTLEKELHNAKEEIESLRKENKKLVEKFEEEVEKTRESLADRRGDDCSDLNLNKENDILSKSIDVLDRNIELLNAITQTESNDDNDDKGGAILGQDTTETITPEAVKKLEERFKDTMERLAELSDEKQRLEHLVLQLQSETETIGEYVTLYQKQRGVLQERAKEKEEAFRQLTEQRNQQQEQLHKLKMLVAELIREKNDSSKILTTENDEIRKDEANNLGQEHVSSDNKIVPSLSIIKDKTTSQILDLLTEIKECKETCALEPNFHPCPWCSGKLITV